MRQSPRYRRLCSDQRAMLQLKAESSIVSYSMPGPMFGGPPEVYLITFRGYGLYRPEGSLEVRLRDHHQVMIRLGASYPRMAPELMWKTPIFHPNISSNGIVCLGGYSTHWVPSLRLDQLTEMLWDMIRYQNYDVESPYNREAAQWARSQTAFQFPLDERTLRGTAARLDHPGSLKTNWTLTVPPTPVPPRHYPTEGFVRPIPPHLDDQPEILFMDETAEIIQAELVPRGARGSSAPDILYIE